ncbi:lrr receptor-like serinethreonine-protein kinase erecta [Nicotiana attenuata]|uniref:Lrr receptor-like serinethreonine-protein kinase erecta n=1 Tax=Nicotiana attenuata TaxID=49451 RepID=A0A1J6IJE0_NICAT|nr:lrr receptor-like serinethreonine-protein kinase erecta [Nicotiana attenuata]
MLTGEIPSWLFQMKALKNLFLGKNALKWNNNAKIVPQCMLSGLSLQSCGLVGPIPEWISSQRSIDYLDLSDNKLVGTFPQWLAEMELGTIILSDNNLTGSLLPSLFHSRSLSLLDLSRNRFSGELPENMGNATAIMILILAENSFSGKIPSSITNIYRLLLLDLSKNRLSGTIPFFDPTSFVAYVDLSFNDLSGDVPLTFSQETRILALGGNNFSGSLNRNLTNFYMLEHLDLHDNRLTGEFPDFISEMSTLRSLNLRNNFLQGSVPCSISNLSNLQILDLSHNSFTGSIPSEVGNLVGMIETPSTFSSISFVFTFSIEYTDLIVNWKRSVQGLSSSASIDIYSWLDLSKNHLSGEIPSSIGKLRGLKMLNISYNGLKGKIPATVGNLENLESLDLSHNSLSDPIPHSFTKLQQLTTLDVSNNHLKGKIPVGGQMDTMDDPTYYANNSGLCGFQIQLHCPENKSPQAMEPENESKEPWFAWEAMWIGFPFGFLVSILVILLTGLFTPKKLTQQRSLLRKHARN